MSIEIKDIRNAYISQLKADSDIAIEFTVAPATGANIDYGISKDVGMSMLPKSLRIVQLGRGTTMDNAEIDAEFSGGYQWVWSRYRFNVVATFAENDAKKAEDAESKIDRLIRKAITKDYSLGNVVTNVDVGRTFFRSHPDKDGIHFVIIETSALKHERADVR